MRASILSLDAVPEDLAALLPVHGRVLRTLPGPDGQGYALMELDAPLSLRVKGEARDVRHFLVVPRLRGEWIRPNASLAIGLAYVTDDAALDATTLDFAWATYVAIGHARISESS